MQNGGDDFLEINKISKLYPWHYDNVCEVSLSFSMSRFRAVRNCRPVCTRRAGDRPRFRFSLAMHVIPYELYVHSLPAPTTTLHRDIRALKIARNTNAPARCDLSRYAQLLISMHANRVASRRLNVELTLRNQWNDHRRRNSTSQAAIKGTREAGKHFSRSCKAWKLDAYKYHVVRPGKPSEFIDILMVNLSSFTTQATGR